MSPFTPTTSSSPPLTAKTSAPRWPPIPRVRLTSRSSVPDPPSQIPPHLPQHREVFPLPNHAIAAIAAILSYYLPHDIDARLHNHQWFLIGQGRHPRRTIFIPSTHRRNVRPAELHPADPVTVYMNDEDLPLPTPPRSKTATNATNEAESSSDLTRG